MNLNDSNWIQMGPNETKLDQVNPTEFKWVQVNPSVSKWIQMDPNQSIWFQMKQNESKWMQMNPHGSKWIQINPRESKMRPSESKVKPNEFPPPVAPMVTGNVARWIQGKVNKPTFTRTNKNTRACGGMGWGEEGGSGHKLHTCSRLHRMWIEQNHLESQRNQTNQSRCSGIEWNHYENQTKIWATMGAVLVTRCSDLQGFWFFRFCSALGSAFGLFVFLFSRWFSSSHPIAMYIYIYI